MKAALALNHITFSYHQGPVVLNDLDLVLEEGCLAVLQGISGTGKTTLLSVINGVIPHVTQGHLEGSVVIGGEDMTGKGIAYRARHVGSILQNADDQIVQDRVEDEVAFGLENLGVAQSEMEARIEHALKLVNLKPHLKTRKLSGGQKQRLITATTLAMGQRLILLDEPCANLDRETSISLLRMLKELTNKGYTVLLVEHRLDLVLPYADIVYSLTDGALHVEKDPGALLKHSSEHIPYDKEPLTNSTRLIGISDLYYTVRHVDVIRGITLDIHEGERITVLGPNGCGKTTLLKLLARLIDPSAGGYEQSIIDSQHTYARPEWFQKAGYVYQNPSYQLFMPTVRSEIMRGAASKDRAERMIELFGLQGLEERHPHSLSEGQKRRVGVAAVCATDPKVLFLDEPTVGQDYENLKQMLLSIKTLQKESGCAVVAVTHDARCKEALSDKQVIMKQGRILSSVSPYPSP